MKQLIPTLILLVLLCGTTWANFESTHKLWENGDWAVQRIQDREYLQYSDEEISQLIPLLAKWIPIREELKGHSDLSWKTFESEHDWTPFLNSLPPDHRIRKKWGLSHQAAWVIRVLAENRRIDDDAVLPILIESVAHPSASFTGRDCFYALTALTKLYDGPLTSWGNIDRSNDPEKISEWFQGWLKANQRNQKIVTRELEGRIKNAYLQTGSRLERLVAEQSHALHGFRAPNEEDYHKVGHPLFDIKWDGRFRSSLPGDIHGDGWVWIMARSQSKLIEGITSWERYPSWDALEALPEGATRIYRQTIDGTDWAIEIYVDRLSDAELSAIAEALNKKVEQGGADQPATAPESKSEGNDKHQPEAEGRSQ